MAPAPAHSPAPAPAPAPSPSVFDHCRDDADEAWRTLYAVACLCHPDQGGSRDDLRALCEDARRVVQWPPEWPPEPKLFDIFCKLTDTDPRATPTPPVAEPMGYSRPTSCAALIDWGDVRLVARGIIIRDSQQHTPHTGGQDAKQLPQSLPQPQSRAQ